MVSLPSAFARLVVANSVPAAGDQSRLTYESCFTTSFQNQPVGLTRPVNTELEAWAHQRRAWRATFGFTKSRKRETLKKWS